MATFGDRLTLIRLTIKDWFYKTMRQWIQDILAYGTHSEQIRSGSIIYRYPSKDARLYGYDSVVQGTIRPTQWFQDTDGNEWLYGYIEYLDETSVTVGARLKDDLTLRIWGWIVANHYSLGEYQDEKTAEKIEEREKRKFRYEQISQETNHYRS